MIQSHILIIITVISQIHMAKSLSSPKLNWSQSCSHPNSSSQILMLTKTQLINFCGHPNSNGQILMLTRTQLVISCGHTNSNGQIIMLIKTKLIKFLWSPKFKWSENITCGCPNSSDKKISCVLTWSKNFGLSGIRTKMAEEVRLGMVHKATKIRQLL